MASMLSEAGSGYSTVGDMARFVAALQRHQLLDAEHWKLLTTLIGLDAIGGSPLETVGLSLV